ncbi:hypothetical protein ASPWEDRAFT_172590 [Aspergillus wentii DTO 134E9]|uniref:Arrestin-like N-terminal domain-containing protein n=1 Tax=Aspergillus wentii DTO 134E9 TaxID=1073089 RepID=A0A1L9RLJ8_ASPWE|nr:uncharacterized protein ASPWEDRAFT_172590 [Aspergillus wentii DTO 134E9]OJJ35791.1 hypothetical protein ASPWEDRAFT_172590 [Aspergillus wentii DTO 134E9]
MRRALSIQLRLVEPVLFLPDRANIPTVVRGCCILRLTQRLTVKRLTVNFRGVSCVQWSNRICEKEVLTDRTITLFARPHSQELPSATVRLPSYEDSELGRGFPPGTYAYDFEMRLDPHLPESMLLERTRVRYEISLVAEHSGLWTRSTCHRQEVPVVRCPTEDFLHDNEPVRLMRSWPGRFRYEIVMARKASLGQRLPITVLICSLRRLRCRGLRILLSEKIKYVRQCGQEAPFAAKKTKLLLQKGYDENHITTPMDMLESIKTLDHLGEPRDEKMEKMEVEVQLPPSGTESSRTLNMGTDIRYKNVCVSHCLEVSFLFPFDNESNSVWFAIAMVSDRGKEYNVTASAPFQLHSSHAKHDNICVPAYPG